MWTEVNKYTWQVQAVLLNSQFPYGMQRFNGPISLHQLLWTLLLPALLWQWNWFISTGGMCSWKSLLPQPHLPEGQTPQQGHLSGWGHCSQPDSSCSASPWPHTDVILHLLHHCTSLPQSQPDYVGYHFCLSIQALNSQQFGSLWSSEVTPQLYIRT